MAQHAYKEAFKAYNDGALSACVLHCRTALQADPRHYHALLLLGRVHCDCGEFPEAMRVLRRAIQLEPTRPDAMRGLAIVSQACGDFQAYMEVSAELLSLASHGNDPARVGEELEKFCRAHEDHAGRQEGDIAAARVLADVLDRTGGWVGDDLSRRIRAKVYEWAVNSYRDLRDGTAKQDRQSQACGLLERACVDDLSPESQRYMNTMIDLQKSMGPPGHLRCLDWCVGVLRSTGTVNRALLMAALDSADALLPCAWSPDVCRVAAHAAHATPWQLQARHALGTALLGTLVAMAADPIDRPRLISKAEDLLQGRGADEKFQISKKFAAAAAAMQSGRFHDAIKSSQMSVEMVRDKSEKLARDSRVPSQLPWACRVDAATARVVKARALIALQSHAAAVREAQQVCHDAPTLLSLIAAQVLIADATQEPFSRNGVNALNGGGEGGSGGAGAGGGGGGGTSSAGRDNSNYTSNSVSNNVITGDGVTGADGNNNHSSAGAGSGEAVTGGGADNNDGAGGLAIGLSPNAHGIASAPTLLPGLARAAAGMELTAKLVAPEGGLGSDVTRVRVHEGAVRELRGLTGDVNGVIEGLKREGVEEGEWVGMLADAVCGGVEGWVRAWEAKGAFREGQGAVAARAAGRAVAAAGRAQESLRRASLSAPLLPSASLCNPACVRASALLSAATVVVPSDGDVGAWRLVMARALLDVRRGLLGQEGVGEEERERAAALLTRARTEVELAAASAGVAQGAALAWLGVDCERGRDIESAQRYYQKALAADPACAEAGRRLCALLVAKGAGDGVVERLCRAMAGRSERAAWAVKAMGQLLEKRGEWREAMGAYQRCTRMDSNDADAWEGLGRAYVGLGMADAAKMALLTATSLDPTRSLPRVLSASIALYENDTDESLELHKQALLIDKHCVPALTGLAQALLASADEAFARGAVGLASKQLARAVAAAKAACARDGGVAGGWKTLGDALAMHRHVPVHEGGGEPPLDTIDYALRLLTEGPQAASAILAGYQRRAAMVEMARRAYAKSLFLRPGDRAHRACVLVDVGASLMAESDLRRITGEDERVAEERSRVCRRLMRGAVEASPTSPSAWLALSSVLTTPPEREYALSRALQLDPGNAGAWTALGRLYANMQQTNLAERCWQQARAQDPDYAGVWEAMAGMAAGAGDVRGAFEFARHALGMVCGTEALHYAATCALSLGHATHPLLLPTASRWAELEPWNAAAHHALGLAREARGLMEGALVSLSKAHAMVGATRGGVTVTVPSDRGPTSDPDAVSAAVRVSLARVLARMGKLEEAGMLYENLEMQKAGDSWAMAGAACVVAAKGDAAGAAGMLRVAVGAAEGRGQPDSAHLASALVTALCAASRIDDAIAVTIDASYRQPDTDSTANTSTNIYTHHGSSTTTATHGTPAIDAHSASAHAQWSAGVARCFDCLLAACALRVAAAALPNDAKAAFLAQAGAAGQPESLREAEDRHAMVVECAEAFAAKAGGDAAMRVRVRSHATLAASHAAAARAAGAGDAVTSAAAVRARVHAGAAVHIAPWSERSRVLAAAVGGRVAKLSPALRGGGGAGVAAAMTTPRVCGTPGAGAAWVDVSSGATIAAFEPGAARGDDLNGDVRHLLALAGAAGVGELGEGAMGAAAVALAQSAHALPWHAGLRDAAAVVRAAVGG